MLQLTDKVIRQKVNAGQTRSLLGWKFSYAYIHNHNLKVININTKKRNSMQQNHIKVPVIDTKTMCLQRRKKAMHPSCSSEDYF